MKTKSLLSLVATVVVSASVTVSQKASAEPPTGNFKLIYVCGEELNMDLLDGKGWESAVGYYTGNKAQAYLRAGWPGFPRKAEITRNSEKSFQVEGTADSDTYARLLISKTTTMTEIGSEKHPVANAINQLLVMGADLRKNLFCIYYPENDVFRSK